MRTAALATVLVAATAGSATGERLTVLTGRLGLGAGNVDQADQTLRDPDRITVVGATVSWEDGPLPYPAKPGYALRGALVPELHLDRLSVDEQGLGKLQDTTLALAIGLRIDVGLAQREMGLLKVSARAGFFAAAKLGVLGDAERTPLVGVRGGEFLWISDRARIGVELDVTRIQGQQDPAVIFPVGGGLARVPPWAFSDPRYTTITAALTFGGIL